jgi:hypothetical protein
MRTAFHAIIVIGNQLKITGNREAKCPGLEACEGGESLVPAQDLAGSFRLKGVTHFTSAIGPTGSDRPSGRHGCGNLYRSVMPKQRQQNDDRNWNAEQPQKQSASKAHCYLLLIHYGSSSHSEGFNKQSSGWFHIFVVAMNSFRPEALRTAFPANDPRGSMRSR